MRNFYSVAILLTLAVVCTAKPTTSKKGCIAADFYIGETVATTPIACHNDKTIAARYFHICDIKYHFMECPAVKKCLKKHGIKARSENNLEDNGRNIVFYLSIILKLYCMMLVYI